MCVCVLKYLVSLKINFLKKKTSVFHWCSSEKATKIGMEVICWLISHGFNWIWRCMEHHAQHPHQSCPYCRWASCYRTRPLTPEQLFKWLIYSQKTCDSNWYFFVFPIKTSGFKFFLPNPTIKLFVLLLLLIRKLGVGEFESWMFPLEILGSVNWITSSWPHCQIIKRMK